MRITNKTNHSHFGSSARCKGGFLLAEDMIIKGSITGFINNTKDLIIDESAILKANLKAENIVVKGKVEGNVEARDRLEIAATGEIIGDIKAKLISVRPGCHLIGQCHSNIINHQPSAIDDSQAIRKVEPAKKDNNQAFGRAKLQNIAEKILSMLF